jgi:glutaminyl-peptide cyclotransferase
LTTLRRLGLLLAVVLAPVACAGGGEDPAAGEATTATVSRPTTRTPASEERRRPEPLRRLRAVVVATYPHDTGSYTQGLLLDAAGTLLESSGRYGVSDLRRVDLDSGEVMRRVPLPDEVFAEGLARLPAAGGAPERLVQISWREGIALVWDAASFERLGEHRYEGDGWGLCHDAAGGRLVMSDGSSWLTFRDPQSFSETGGVEAKLEGRPLANLNELECVDGRVWANVYGSESLVEIDLADGRVTATVDASGLLEADEQHGAEVLNGIAYDPADGTFLVTGKLWPKLFRVRFEPLDGGG